MASLLQKHRVFIVGAICGLLVGLVLTFGLAARTGSTSTLIHFAPPHTDAALAPPSIEVLPARRGYDGQFYYRLARAPLSTADHVDGVRLDHPALRMTRIGYPAASRAIAWGPLGLVDAMLTVNVLAYAAIGVAGMGIAQAAGRRPLAGLALLCAPAFIYGTTMSVTDTLSGALLLFAIVLLLHRRYAASAVLLCCAALTRETALLLPAVLLLGLLVGRWRGRRIADIAPLVAVGLSPLVTVGLWQLVVVSRWRELGVLSAGGKNLTLPLLGPFVTDSYLHPTTSEAWMDILVPAACAAIIVLTLVALARREMPTLSPLLAACLVVAAVIASCVGPALLATYRSAVRGMGDAIVFAGIAALHGTGRWSKLALVSLVVVGLGLMVWELRIAPDLS